MNTLNLTDAQLHQLIDALDAVLLLLEPDYTEWCSDGNDPTDHPWYRVANIPAALEAA